jgi:tetratricopeptide (TPR) repeat protein
MSWKVLFIMFVFTLVLDSILLALGMDILQASVIGFFVLIFGYYGWWLIKNLRLSNILNEQCDPEKYIAEYEKLKKLQKSVTFQNHCNVNIAVGFISLGHFEEALSILTDDVNPKKSKNNVFQATYHLDVFYCHLCLDNLTEAANIYENNIKALRGRVIIPQLTYSYEDSVALYHYMLNKSPETARVYLAQIEYLYNAYSKKIGKRGKLENIYNRAVMLLELGEKEAAVKKLKTVAENANKLWIAEMSRKKLMEMESDKTA